MFRKSLLLTAIILIATSGAFAQKVRFISSNLIENIPEVQQANQSIRTVVEGWKSELDAYRKQIDDLDLEIRRNRFVWSESEKVQKSKDLADLESKYEAILKQKFEQGGEYERLVTQVMKTIEPKIYAALCLELFFPALFIGR